MTGWQAVGSISRRGRVQAAWAAAVVPLAIYLFGQVALGNTTNSGGDVARGKKVYNITCVACHGKQAEGSKNLMAPALHGQEVWYIVTQLHKFKDGIRGYDKKDAGGLVMRPMAQTLVDDQAIEDVAAYLAALEGPVAEPLIKGDVAAGKKLYGAFCAACHGANAEGKEALKTPALAGQNDWYIVAQIQKFKNGMRGMHPKDITGLQMKGMAATLTTDQAVNDVAAYLVTMHD